MKFTSQGKLPKDGGGSPPQMQKSVWNGILSWCLLEMRVVIPPNDNSYDVLSTTTWYLSLVRQRNSTASGSRRSRPSRKVPLRNGAQEARARRFVPRRSEPLPPSTVLLPPIRRRTAQREPDAWIPGGEFPRIFMTPPPIRSWGSPRTPTCSSRSGK